MPTGPRSTPSSSWSPPHRSASTELGSARTRPARATARGERPTRDRPVLRGGPGPDVPTYDPGDDEARRGLEGHEGNADGGVERHLGRDPHGRVVAGVPH